MPLDLNLDTSNPEQLAQIFEQIESGAEPAPAADAAPKEAPAAAESPPEAPAQPADASAPQQDREGTAQAGDEDAAGVATRDGKHVIPYSVLRSERERATRAEQLAREAQERVAALEAQLTANQGAKPGAPAPATPTEPAAADISVEDMAALREDFPTVYKAIQAALARAEQLESKLQPVEASVRNAEAERARSDTDTVQEAIDAVPVLAHIQATDAEAFELAKQFDSSLRAQAAWRDRSLTERFTKVAEMVEAALGPIALPQAVPTPTPAELAKAARAKAEQSARSSRGNVPTSLSEFPAGQHAAEDEREAAENMTPQQLAEKFARMTPDQMDAYFQTL